jgi:hypothetical protein
MRCRLTHATGYSPGRPTRSAPRAMLAFVVARGSPAHAPLLLQALRSGGDPARQATFLLARASGAPLLNPLMPPPTPRPPPPTPHCLLPGATLTYRLPAWLQTSSSLGESRLPGAEPEDAAAAAARLSAGEHALSFGCHEVAIHHRLMLECPRALLSATAGCAAAACASVQMRGSVRRVRQRRPAGGKLAPVCSRGGV